MVDSENQSSIDIKLKVYMHLIFLIKHSNLRKFNLDDVLKISHLKNMT